MLRSITATILSAVLLVSSVGCSAQATISSLTATLGNAAAQVATIQGNTVLAAQLTADTAAAVSAINNWKSGTPADNAIQALGIVESDLSLILSQLPPAAQAYGSLISLAIVTAESIIALLPKTPVPAGASAAPMARAVVNYNGPKNSKDFKKQWNAIVANHPEISKAAAIK